MNRKNPANKLNFKKYLSEEKSESPTEKEPDDYCPIGMAICPICGANHGYPVSGCRNCNQSFVN